MERGEAKMISISFVIDKFANGWTVIATIKEDKKQTKIYEYIANDIFELCDTITKVSESNYDLEEDYF